MANLDLGNVRVILGATRIENASTHAKPKVNAVMAAFVSATAKHTAPAIITVALLITDKWIRSIIRKRKVGRKKEVVG